MSQYINFFIRSKSDEFIPLNSYCRSNAVYTICSEFVPYEKVSALSAQKVMEFINIANKELADIDIAINRSNTIIDAVKSYNNSIDEKNEAIYSELLTIEDLKESKSAYLAAIELFNILKDFIEDKEFDESYNANKFIYAGIEIGEPTIEDIV